MLTKNKNKATPKKQPSRQQHTKRSDPEAPTNKRDRRKADQRRQDRRDELWPNSGDEVWTRHGTAGFTTIPRVLPLMMVLLRHLTKNGGGDPSSVYMELWGRVYDEGYVRIGNEMDHVYAAGYTGTRSARTWRERMRLLEDHGFIRIKPNGAQTFGHVLLVNPLLVAARLKKEGKVPDEWWAAFFSRADEIGAEIPRVSE
jgi:hypothetical protein